MNDVPTDGLQRAREIIVGLSDREKTILRYELEEDHQHPAAEDGGAWDYQRQPYGRGWIQRERKVLRFMNRSARTVRKRSTLTGLSTGSRTAADAANT